MKTKRDAIVMAIAITIFVFVVATLASCAAFMDLGASTNTPCEEDHPLYDKYKEDCEKWRKTHPQEYAAWQRKVAKKQN